MFYFHFTACFLWLVHQALLFFWWFYIVQALVLQKLCFMFYDSLFLLPYHLYITLINEFFFVSIKHGLCFMFCYSCDYAFNINLTRFMFYVLPDFLNYSHNSATVYHLLQSHFTCTYCQMIWQALVLCFLFYIT